MAISSGRPICPRGIRDSNVALGGLVEEFFLLGGGDLAGGQDVDADRRSLSSLSQTRAQACWTALLPA